MYKDKRTKNDHHLFGILLLWDVAKAIRMRIRFTQSLAMANRRTIQCFLLRRQVCYQFTASGGMVGLVVMGGNLNQGLGIKCTRQPTLHSAAPQRVSHNVYRA